MTSCLVVQHIVCIPNISYGKVFQRKQCEEHTRILRLCDAMAESAQVEQLSEEVVK